MHIISHKELIIVYKRTRKLSKQLRIFFSFSVKEMSLNLEILGCPDFILKIETLSS